MTHPHSGADDRPSLDRWLQRIEALHPVEMDLGLDRVARVAVAAGLDRVSFPVILVGGTNGKGTTVRRLAAVHQAAGRRVGSYLSPHLEHFGERIGIDGLPADDATLVRAIEHVEGALGGVSLTYFEWTTLAAMQVFVERGVDLAILEVGLGGRLDATNLWDADLAIITSIALDHQDWLGDTREAIGLEKVEIARRDAPLVIGDPDPPDGMLERAVEIGARIWHVDIAREPPWTPPCDASPAGVGERGPAVAIGPGESERRRQEVVLPAFDRRNLACVRAAVAALATRLPTSDAALRQGLAVPALPGRFERWRAGERRVILDVAHNPAAAAALAERLRATPEPIGSPVAVLGMLGDKDVEGVIAALADHVERWYIGGLETRSRGLAAEPLAARVSEALERHGSRATVRTAASVEAAWRQALAEAPPDAGILVTGSFLTVGAVRSLLVAGASAPAGNAVGATPGSAGDS